MTPKLKIELAVKKILFANPTSDKIVQMLEGQGNVVQKLVSTASVVMKIITESSKGNRPPGFVGIMVDSTLAELAELANAAGIKVSDKDIETAKQLMAKTYVQTMQKQQGIAGPKGMPQQPAQPTQPAPQQAAPVPQPRGLIAAQMGA